MTKNKSLIDAVRVGTPCSEDWDSMKGSDQVRFCSHCSKDVNNLSAVTRKEAAKLVAKSGANICIRYVVHPATKRPIFAEQLLQITRRAPSIAAGVMSASLSIANSVYAQSDANKASAEPVAAVVRDQSIPDGTDRPARTTGRLSGVIKDSAGAVLPSALLTLTSKFGTVSGSTDNDGAYSFAGLEPGNYRFDVSAPGFVSVSREISVEPLDMGLDDTTLEPGGFEITVDVQMDITNYQVVGGAMFAVEYTSPLSTAVAAGDIEQTRELIVKGADVNAKEDSYSKITPLFVAVEIGNIEMVRLLLDSGAKVSARDEEKQNVLTRLDSDATPELVDLLVAYGAKVRQKDKEGNTPLMIAARSASGAVLKRLIESGAELNAANNDGETALMIAAETGNTDGVRALLLAGADPDLKDSEGDAALDYADDDAIKELIRTRGTSPVPAATDDDTIEEPADSGTDVFTIDGQTPQDYGPPAAVNEPRPGPELVR